MSLNAFTQKKGVPYSTLALRKNRLAKEAEFERAGSPPQFLPVRSRARASPCPTRSGEVCYAYAPTKEGKWIVNLVGRYKGFLQADAAGGFDVLCKDGSIIAELTPRGWLAQQRKARDAPPDEDAATNS